MTKQTEPRLFVVINPSSGKSEPEEIEALLARHLAPSAYETFRLDGSNSLRAAIADAIERGFTGIVAAGGDGTVSGVASGVAHTAVPMGIIPTGTGNGLAQELKLPVSVNDAVALLANRPAVRTIDAIQIDDHYSVLRAGVGFETEVIEATPREEKRQLGGAAYFLTALRRSASLRDHRITIKIDEQTHQWRNVRHVALVNGAKLGAPEINMKWGPHIKPDDGRIDICIIKHLSLVQYLRLFWHASQNETHHDEAVHYLAASKTIEITADRPLPIHSDGEHIGETPFTAFVRPHSVSVFVPPQEVENE